MRPDLKVQVKGCLYWLKSLLSVLIITVGLYLSMKSVLGSEVLNGLKISTMCEVGKRFFES